MIEVKEKKHFNRTDLLGPREEYYGAEPDHDEHMNPVIRIKCEFCGRLFLASSRQWHRACTDKDCLKRSLANYRMKNKADHAY